MLYLLCLSEAGAPCSSRLSSLWIHDVPLGIRTCMTSYTHGSRLMLQAAVLPHVSLLMQPLCMSLGRASVLVCCMCVSARTCLLSAAFRRRQSKGVQRTTLSVFVGRSR